MGCRLRMTSQRSTSHTKLIDRARGKETVKREMETKAVRAAVTSNQRAPQRNSRGESDEEIEAREEREISLRAT